MTTSNTAPIAYTLGEPAGIGADIILQLSLESDMCDLVVIGDQRLLDARASTLGIDSYNLKIVNVPIEDARVCGQPSLRNVPGVVRMLDEAIDGCLAGRYSGMVTGPLHKGIINDSGRAFSGHTEYLAERTGAIQSVMVLASSTMRVGLYTTHLPLKGVSEAITEALILKVSRIVHQDLKLKFGIDKPRILICGLNPHAGEGGHLGREEIEIIEPAIQRLQKEGLNVLGPLPADTAFTPGYLQQADIVMAMYHDQGLPVLKSHGFGDAANITFGLPILRSSVDHGTAFDLAGTGKSDVGSLRTALSVLRTMAENHAVS